MTNPKYSAVTDVYAFMFICDLITFLIVVFGYASFGPSVSHCYSAFALYWYMPYLTVTSFVFVCAKNSARWAWNYMVKYKIIWLGRVFIATSTITSTIILSSARRILLPCPYYTSQLWILILLGSPFVTLLLQSGTVRLHTFHSVTTIMASAHITLKDISFQ